MKKILSESMARFWPNWHRHIIGTTLRKDFVTLTYFFQGHQGYITLWKSLFCTLSSEPTTRFWPNWHRYIIGKTLRNYDFCDLDIIFQGHQGHVLCKSLVWNKGQILTKLRYRNISGRTLINWIRACNPLYFDGFSYTYWYNIKVLKCPFCTLRGHR